MEYIVIASAALVASLLTLFSGFGLGTILLPVFAIFFPLDVSVALTAVVHLLNNLFKLSLLGRYANRAIVFRFGIPAIIAALAGAWLLLRLSGLDPIADYSLMGKNFQITPVKLIVAILMVAFASIELIPAFDKLAFEPKYLPAGGLVSGFFGGLSGHQGALRSAFLIRCGLSRESFIATGVVIACIVDLTRLSVYAAHFSSSGISENIFLLITASASAFMGVVIGKRLVKKVKMRTIQVIVSIMLSIIAVGLGAGFI
jgi:uncharacterized protein